MNAKELITSATNHIKKKEKRNWNLRNFVLGAENIPCTKKGRSRQKKPV